MAAEINLSNIIEIVAFSITVVTIYVRNQVKVKELEMKIIALEQRLTKAEQEDHFMYKKLDEIIKMLTEVKIELSEKQDRA